MGRIKRGYVREIPDDELKRDYRLFAIACEGSKREREYFQQLEGISRRVIVEYIKDEEYEKDPPSSPQHVLRRALEYAEKVDLNDEDSVWLVMDIDRWLLYHTTACLDNLQIATGDDCKEALGAQTPQGYDPKRYIVLMKEAARNARAADKSNGWFPEAGSTKMHELVDALMRFVSAREYEEFVEGKLRPINNK